MRLWAYLLFHYQSSGLWLCRFDSNVQKSWMLQQRFRHLLDDDQEEAAPVGHPSGPTTYQGALLTSSMFTIRKRYTCLAVYFEVLTAVYLMWHCSLAAAAD